MLVLLDLDKEVDYQPTLLTIVDNTDNSTVNPQFIVMLFPILASYKKSCIRIFITQKSVSVKQYHCFARNYKTRLVKT